MKGGAGSGGGERGRRASVEPSTGAEHRRPSPDRKRPRRAGEGSGHPRGMVSRLRRHQDAIERLAARQGGFIARAQLISTGFSAAQARSELTAQRWSTELPGVYLVRAVGLGPTHRVWAGVLYAGRGAAATGRTALWLSSGRRGDPPGILEIAVPTERRVTPQPGLRIIRSTRLVREAQDSLPPPSVRPAVAALDAAARTTRRIDVIAVVTGAIQQRLTTAETIAEALEALPRHPHRRLIIAVLADAAEGVASPLEHRYLHDVHRAHGLPAARLNHRDRDGAGRTVFRDVLYATWLVVVELDGREFHAAARAHRDRHRDNDASVRGLLTLRYGWHEVVGDPCGVAGQVAEALAVRGWGGAPRRCSAACSLPAGTDSPPTGQPPKAS